MVANIGFRLGLGAVATTDPTKALGTCAGAWMADYGVTLNGSGVAAWAPRWGTAPAAVQAVAANQPTFVASRPTADGKPEIVWDGVNDTLIATLLAALPATSLGVVFAGRLASTVASGRIVEINVGGASLNQALYLASSYGAGAVVEPGVRSAGSWGTPGAITVPGTSSDRFALAISRNGSTWTTAAKGVTGGGTLASSVSGANTVNIGQGSGVYFGGTLSALWLFSTPIDVQAALAAVRQYYPDA